jgi:hypothetical protein
MSAHRGYLETMGLPDPRVIPAMRVHKVCQGMTVLQVKRAIKETSGIQVFKGYREMTEHQESKAIRVIRDLQAQDCRLAWSFLLSQELAAQPWARDGQRKPHSAVNSFWAQRRGILTLEGRAGVMQLLRQARIPRQHSAAMLWLDTHTESEVTIARHSQQVHRGV